MDKMPISAHVRDFVSRHKVALTATATAVACTATFIAVNRLVNTQMTDFIKDKGLWDEYLTPED